MNAEGQHFEHAYKWALLLQCCRTSSFPRPLEPGWEQACRRARSGRAASLAELTAAFDKHISPSTTQPRTRANVSIVIAWACAQGGGSAHVRGPSGPVEGSQCQPLTCDLVSFGRPRSPQSGARYRPVTTSSACSASCANSLCGSARRNTTLASRSYSSRPYITC